MADRIEAVMTGRQPMTVPEIRAALGPVTAEEKDGLQYIVAMMGRFGRIVRAQVRGGWRSDNYSYALWDDWVGEPLTEADPVAARMDVARRYLRAFGPATTDDLKWWTGWGKRITVTALDGLDDVVPVQVNGLDSWLLADERDQLAEPGDGRSVRLLPVWDPYFMAYATSPKGRARQVAEADYPRIYDKAGNGTSTVIQDGMAAGIWELNADGGVLTVAPFTELRWDDVEAEVANLATVIDTGLRLERAPGPGPLSDGPRNTFLSPISLRMTAK